MSSINRIAHFYIMKKYFLTLVILCVVSLQLSAVSVPQWITAFENQNATNSWICFQKEFNINAERKSKVDDNTARMQSIKQLGV